MKKDSVICNQVLNFGSADLHKRLQHHCISRGGLSLVLFAIRSDSGEEKRHVITVPVKLIHVRPE